MVNKIHYRWDFVGLSTDTKPTPEESPKVVNGSTYYESDTSKLFVFYKDTWYERKPLGGGGGSSVNVVQDTGTSTTDVMSQNATTSMIYVNPSTKSTIRIGSGANAGGYGVAIGFNAAAQASTNSIAIGPYSVTASTAPGSVAIGANAIATMAGEFNIGSPYATSGYNYSHYRLLTGLYDPQNAHDAATKGYVDNAVAGAGGSDGARTLKQSDYNWPADNPDGVALWLMPAGYYRASDEEPVKAYFTSTFSYTANATNFNVLVGSTSDYGTSIFRLYASSNSTHGYSPAEFYVLSRNGSTLSKLILYSVYDRLTSTSTVNPLSANQGKVLKDMIDALDARVTALEGN